MRLFLNYGKYFPHVLDDLTENHGRTKAVLLSDTAPGSVKYPAALSDEREPVSKFAGEQVLCGGQFAPMEWSRFSELLKSGSAFHVSLMTGVDPTFVQEVSNIALR